MESRCKIFIVDKSNDNLELISQRLRKSLDSDIKTFNNAEDCLNFLKFEKPNLVLIDQKIGQNEGKIKGDELSEKIKEVYGDEISTIVFSSRCSMKLAAKMIGEGANDVVSEPINKEKEKPGSRLAKSSKQQIRKIKDKSGEKNAKIFILSTMVIVLAAFLYMDNRAQHWLPYFAGAFLAISVLLVFLSHFIKNIFIGRNFQ